MSLGDFLFRLAPQEQHSAPAPQRFLSSKANSVAAVLVSVNGFACPLDKIAVIRSIQVAGEAGAAQTCDRITLDWYADSGSTFLARMIHIFLGTGLLRNTQQFFPADMVMMPGESVVGNGFFSAAGVANQISVQMSGLLLPKGNVQLR